jgi:hypothetical protein
MSSLLGARSGDESYEAPAPNTTINMDTRPSFIQVICG